MTSAISAHVYEVRPRKDKRGVDLISDALPFGRRSRAAIIRVFDESGSMIQSHEQVGDFREP